MTIVVVGASSGPGRLLFEKLRDRGDEVIGLARTPRGIEANGSKVRFIALDASDPQKLASIVDETTTLIHCSKPEILSRFLEQKPALKRLVALGSTRVYTRFPDDKCSRVAAMSHAIWMNDIPATILHPTMIYGAPGLNNIERVARIARILPIIPLPENGTSLIQPVYAGDVVRAIMASLDNDDTIGRTIVLPGKEAVTYQRFIELCIKNAGASCRVVSLPYIVLSLLAPLTHLIPGIPIITQDEIQRLLENKAYDVTDMKQLLGIDPIDLETGLGRLFEGC